MSRPPMLAPDLRRALGFKVEVIRVRRYVVLRFGELVGYAEDEPGADALIRERIGECEPSTCGACNERAPWGESSP